MFFMVKCHSNRAGIYAIVNAADDRKGCFSAKNPNGLFTGIHREKVVVEQQIGVFRFDINGLRIRIGVNNERIACTANR